MRRYNKNLGDFGEDTAEKYLQDCGYEILCRNFCIKGGEIDIVAKDADILVFVEVKTRSSGKFGSAAEGVDKKKIMHMRQAAERYISQNPCDCEMRFDIIEVYAEIIDGLPCYKSLTHIKEIIIDI